jgi:REP element-mobilizing transposase RayT
MVIAYHAIFTTYGFWLPNDPRGSWSTFVGAWELFLAGGKATKTNERASLAWAEHDHAQRQLTKEALKFSPVEFDGSQAHCVAMGFAEAVADAKYRVYACSVLPSHVHMVIGRHDRSIEKMVGHLKSAATRSLDAKNLHPFAESFQRDGRRQSPWAERCWKVFLDSATDMVQAIKYVEQNPVKEGKKLQRWSFVRGM